FRRRGMYPDAVDGDRTRIGADGRVLVVVVDADVGRLVECRQGLLRQFGAGRGVGLGPVGAVVGDPLDHQIESLGVGDVADKPRVVVAVGRIGQRDTADRLTFGEDGPEVALRRLAVADRNLHGFAAVKLAYEA